MKLVVAIVRPEKLSAVLESLFRSEVRGLTINRVQGHGGETEHVETYRGTTVKMELLEKVRLEIGVSDHFVEPTVSASWGRRGRAASATARSSSCPWRRSTGSAPARRTRRRSRRYWLDRNRPPHAEARQALTLTRRGSAASPAPRTGRGGSGTTSAGRRRSSRTRHHRAWPRSARSRAR